MSLRLILIISLHLQFFSAKELEKGSAVEEGEVEKQDSSITKKLVTIPKPLKLACAKTGWNSTGSEVVWFYKSCGSAGCGTEQKGDGHKICGFQGLQQCSLRLNVERPQTGLYKCYRMEEKIGYVTSATLVITYEIQVLERNLEPEFLEPPEDMEAFVGNDVLFLCKVKSTLPLHVNWYKRVPKSNGGFQYENKYYQLLNGTELNKNKDVSISKLRFKRLSLEDSGIYACGAINEAGIRYKEAKLIVEESKEDFPAEPVQKPFGEHWKIVLFISAIVFLLVVIKCMACIGIFKKSPRESGIPKGRQRARHIHQGDITSDPNDTSDYEHVISL